MFGDKLKGLSQRLDEERRAERAVVEARMLIQRLRSENYTVVLADDQETIRISPRPPDDIAARLRASKPALLQVLRAQAPKP